MTWRHVACIIAALALPVICGISHTCSETSLKEVIGLSSIVIAAVMGNATSSISAKKADKKASPDVAQ